MIALEFDRSTLQALCDVLGATDSGLSGAQVGQLLAHCGFDDPEPETTKRYRLFAALDRRQDRDRCANHVLRFVEAAMQPVRFVTAPDWFEDLRGGVNEVLGFAGWAIDREGRIHSVSVKRQLAEPEERAACLRRELDRRRVHPDVLRFCRAELLVDDYFNAVLESVKSLADPGSGHCSNTSAPQARRSSWWCRWSNPRTGTTRSPPPRAPCSTSRPDGSVSPPAHPRRPALRPRPRSEPGWCPTR